jgi:uncharacterized protein YndB with AHSA1/START domain
MATQGKTVTLRRVIQAPPAQVCRAFTNANGLREWLCDVATAVPRKGGRLYVYWDDGYYAAGEFVAVTPDKKAAFTWLGKGEPAPTRVEVALAARKGGTQVTLTHSGIGTGKAWAGRYEEFVHAWEVGLENLQSVLETGVDLRVVRRPMLGIWLGEEMNAELAAKSGLPVAYGVRLSAVIDGMGAQAAGLAKDDVIVGLAGKKVTGYASFTPALQGRRAGDIVPVTYYRGGEKRAARFQLASRPMPDIPATPQALAEAVRSSRAAGNAELDKCFEGVSEEQAAHCPAPGEWSAKHVLAHLIVGERGTQAWIVEQIGSQERWADDYAGNNQAQLDAVLTVYSGVPDLLAELRRCEAETQALLAALPDSLVARKGAYWRLAFALVQGNQHTLEHAAQIRAAIAAGG